MREELLTKKNTTEQSLQRYLMKKSGNVKLKPTANIVFNKKQSRKTSKTSVREKLRTGRAQLSQNVRLLSNPKVLTSNVTRETQESLRRELTLITTKRTKTNGTEKERQQTKRST